MNWFTSDTHFSHVNIIKYSHRPYVDTEHMNAELINNWNQVVKPDDLVYHLGDVAFGDKNKIPSLVSRLNGHKVLIFGNHDLKHGRLMSQIVDAGFEAIHEELYVKIDGHDVYMRHIPDMEFIPSEKATYHLCGHVHDSWTRTGPILNVGVDVRNYRPVSLQECIDTPEIRGKSHRGY